MFKNLIFLFTSHSLLALTTLNVTVSSDNNPGGIGRYGRSEILLEYNESGFKHDTR